jgi:ankyrin repeat protein
MTNSPVATNSGVQRGTCLVLFLCCLTAQVRAQQHDSLERQLFAAVHTENLVTVEHLLQQGADTQARTTNGVTVLMDAAETGNVAVVSLLLQQGAQVDARDDQDDTALTHAAQVGWVEAVRLLGRFSDRKEKNRALFAAIQSGAVSVLVTDSPVETPPTQLEPIDAKQSWSSTIESLLESGADIEARNQDGSTPLIWAAQFAQTEAFKLLIRRGARLDVKDKTGNTPLIAAACECALATMNSAYDVVKILLDRGADVNARSKDGSTALMSAASGFGGAAIVELLLDHGADPTLKDHRGNTAISLAKQKDREDKVQLIKEAMFRSH